MKMNFFNDPFYLNIYYSVLFVEKDIAKQNGLKWDPEIKKWYSKRELHNFLDGDDWIDNLDYVCIEFNIVDYKITDWMNKKYPEYNDRLPNLKAQVEEAYKKQQIKLKLKKELDDEELDDEINTIINSKFNID